jgi:hypothetical protein
MSLMSQYPVLRGPLSYQPGLLPAAPGLNVLKDRLGDFRQEVCQPGQDFDLERGRTALDQLASELDLSFCTIDDSAPAHQQFLSRLAGLIAREMQLRSGSELATVGGGYAAVVAAMSRIHPQMDFAAPLGQLLELMARLFSERENSWKDIYQCLRSIPDTVAAKQALTRVCLAEIREWFDAGVQNLFSLQGQLQGQIDGIQQKISELEQRLAASRRALDNQQSRFEGRGNVASFAAMAARREIQSLQQQLDEANEQLDGRQGTLGLIESDIGDFEQILRGARRAYRLQVVSRENSVRK